MSQGTITLTNGSKAVVGVDTDFTTIGAGDFITTTIGGVPYTIAVDTVTDATNLVLALPFDGPTASGLGFENTGVNTMALATMGVTTQAQKALRFMIADQTNWRKIFSNDEEITVITPAGQEITGMSWGYLSQLLKEIDIDQIIANADRAEASAEAAHTSETNAANSAAAALASANSASADAGTANAAMAGAELAEQGAQTAQAGAEAAQTAAETAQAGSETARDQAEEYANSINPELLLHKDANLSDLADRAAAWLNVRPIGSTPLAADPVGPYDATTQRWVENYVGGGGGTGPNMNGVQNFGVGMPVLWTSRAFIPAWAVTSDGQVLNRADWPELWAHAQMHTPIDDADWLANPGKRGNYSNGDGSTTFRVPDLNGVQDGSIRGLYGRGDGGGFYVPGTVFENGAPEIEGSFLVVNGPYTRSARIPVADVAGAFTPLTSQGSANTFASAGTVTSNTGIQFNASRSSPAYGRSQLEVRGNNFAAVWIIRASGGFTAANTLWSVNNRDGVAPAPGVVTVGGKISSNYYIGDKLKHGFDLQSVLTSGQSVTEPELRTTIYNDDGSTYRTLAYTFRSSGYGGTVIAHMPGQTNSWGDWQNLLATQRTTFLTGDTDSPTGGVVFGFSTGHSLASAGQYGFQVAGRSTQMFFRTAEAGNFQAWQKLTSAAVSDATLKTQIEDTDGTLSLDNIRAMDLKTFVYKDDEQERLRRGVIAQQIRDIDPCYVKEVHNGDDINLVLDSNPLLMDALAAIKKLSQTVDALRAEIAELKAK